MIVMVVVILDDHFTPFDVLMMRVIGLDARIAAEVGEREIQTQNDAIQGFHGNYHPLLQPAGQRATVRNAGAQARLTPQCELTT
jgi:hypothetical protein